MISKDNIEALIEFGGLVAYKVSWFNELKWETETECFTFNEEYAKRRYAALKDQGFAAKMEAQMIKFNQKEA